VLEAELTTNVITVAQTFGWITAHFRAAMTTRGHRTPVQGDAKGFPDLVLVHPDRRLCWFRELKAGRGKLTPEQERWGSFLQSGGQDWAVWRDTDWDRIVAELSAGRAVVQ
jgi:hypothetical protein